MASYPTESQFRLNALQCPCQLQMWETGQQQDYKVIPEWGLLNQLRSIQESNVHKRSVQADQPQRLPSGNGSIPISAFHHFLVSSLRLSGTFVPLYLQKEIILHRTQYWVPSLSWPLSSGRTTEGKPWCSRVTQLERVKTAWVAVFYVLRTHAISWDRIRTLCPEKNSSSSLHGNGMRIYEK